MVPFVNLPWVSHIMDVASSNGHIPSELHMNRETHEAFTQTLKAQGEKPPKVTWRGDTRIEAPWKFRNVPLVVNDKIPTQGIMLRPIQAMSDPNWLERAMEQNRVHKQQMPAPPQQPNPVAVPLVNGEVRSSEAFPESIETPTDILIRAATACDNVETAIVILLRKGEVEVSSNARRFEVQGLLGAALARVAQEG